MSEQRSTGVANPPSQPPGMLERVTLIIDAFDNHAERLRLDDVAARTGLPRSTSHRILEQLVRLDWLRHTPSGYALGHRSAQVAGPSEDHWQLRAAAHPVLEQLHVRTGTTVQLGVLDFGQIRFLDKIGGLTGASLGTVGGRAPAHVTSLGKAILAWLSPEEVETLLPERLAPKTRHSITDWSALHAELRRIRGRQGLAFERGEYVDGINCIGAGIMGDGEVLGSVSLCTEDVAGPLERFGPLLLSATRHIARLINPDVQHGELPTHTWADGMLETLLAQIDDDTLL